MRYTVYPVVELILLLRTALAGRRSHDNYGTSRGSVEGLMRLVGERFIALYQEM